eukprot:XP_022282269.1 protein C19orf12 homolog isoform X2 [Canis lupus familiaris]
MKKAPEQHRMKKAPEQHRTTASVLTVVTIVVTVVAVVLAKRTVIADVGMAQEGFVMVAKAVAHKLVKTLVDSMAATKEERMTAADAERTMTVGKSWVTGVMEMCLEMVMRKTIKRFVKEPVQEEAIMMVLCSIAEERKKRANEKGASFWAFFVGLFRAQSKETVEEKAWSPLDAWISRLSKSVPQALMELPADKKQKLLNECKGIIRDLKYTDDKMLNRLVMGSEDLKQQLMWKLKKYLNE